jgi:cytochrome c peroxidase
MRQRAALFTILGFTLLVLLGNVIPRWLNSPNSSDVTYASVASTQSDEPIVPIPTSIELDGRRVMLGERLFHDRVLSGNGNLACASCHDLQLGGTDRLTRSVGVTGDPVDSNSPTVFNSGLNFRQFWNGRASTLEDQIDGPILSRTEMNSDWSQIIRKLAERSDYASAFDEIYSDGIQKANVKDAIATYERSLITPNSRFDRFLRGEESAISSVEKEGFRIFKAYGCIACHQGVGVGGNMFAKLGTVRAFYSDGTAAQNDLGRFPVTGNYEDRFVFKVPSLRNVAATAPYFHDGSVPDLRSAVVVMGRFQIGRELSDDETNRIVAFLRTLTGEYRGQSL